MEQFREWVGNTLVSIGKLAETGRFSFAFVRRIGCFVVGTDIVYVEYLVLFFSVLMSAFNHAGEFQFG
jgi:hypothetical protein